VKIIQVALQQRFAAKMRDGFAACIAQTDELLPIGRLRISCGTRINWRRKRDCYVARIRKKSAIAQKAARTCERNRNEWSAGIHRGFERTKLKWANAVLGDECAFGKNKDGITSAKNIFDLLGGLASRASFCAVEGKVAHFFQKRADERHVEHFLLCNEAIRNAEAEHEGKNVKVAAVISYKNFRAGKFHVFFADDANARARKRKKNFQRGGSVTTGSALVFVEQHDGPRGNNPRDEEEAEVDAANNLPGTAQRRGNALPCRACRADGSKPRNLQPCRSFSGGK